ncbi:MAG: thiol peroxidase [Chromatiales bacterium]|jgi:thiol peroxidase|nr:thiol peroxidase [Chromatiales bacterium]MDH4029417.1 thiol peroxidase [Chromatiales bacterium]
MATITLHDNEIHTSGDLPKVGSKAPDFTLTDGDLNDVSLGQWVGKKKLLSIFPSVDTPVCAVSTRKFDEFAREHDDTVMLMISADLPFAQKRFCGADELDRISALSTMRAPEFARNYGVLIEDGPLAGLCARAVVVVDENDTVVHSELVPEIGQEPDYDAALKALG